MINKKVEFPNNKILSNICNFKQYGTRFYLVIIPSDEEEIQKVSEIGSLTKTGVYVGERDFCLGGKFENTIGDVNKLRALTNALNIQRIIMPSNYEKDTNSCTTVNGMIIHRETNDLYRAFTYHYNLIGKPEYFIIYKTTKNKLENELKQIKSGC